MKITIAGIDFGYHDYDERGDVLYLHVGEPNGPASALETVEGHTVEYDEQGAVVGLESMCGVRWRAAICSSHGLRRIWRRVSSRRRWRRRLVSQTHTQVQSGRESDPGYAAHPRSSWPFHPKAVAYPGPISPGEQSWICVGGSFSW